MDFDEDIAAMVQNDQEFIDHYEQLTQNVVPSKVVVDADKDPLEGHNVTFKPAMEGRNFVRVGRNVTTIFGEVSKEDKECAAKNANYTQLQMNEVERRVMSRVVKHSFSVLPKMKSDLRKKGKQELCGEKEPKYDNINLVVEACGASTYASAAVTAATRELYRKTYFRYGAGPLIKAGRCPFPESFCADSLRVITTFLINYTKAPRSRHLYLGHIWQYIAWISPDVTGSVQLASNFQKDYKILHGLVPPQDLETGVRLEHWLDTSVFLALPSNSHNPGQHIRHRNLKNHLYARRYNVRVSDLVKKRRIEEEETHFFKVASNLVSGSAPKAQAGASGKAVSKTQSGAVTAKSQTVVSSQSSVPKAKSTSPVVPAALSATNVTTATSSVGIPSKANSSSTTTVTKATSATVPKAIATKSSTVRPKTRSSNWTLGAPTNSTNTMEDSDSGDESSLQGIGTHSFCMGEREMKYGISYYMFVGALIRGWFCLLRTDEFADLVTTEIRGADRSTLMKHFLPRSKTDQSHEGVTWHMRCCCKEFTSNRENDESLLQSYCVPVCPVHCVSETNRKKVAELTKPQINKLWDILASEMKWSRLIACKHDSYLVRIGGAESVIDAGGDVEFLRVVGRWSTDTSPQLYKRNCERCPARLAFSSWPIAKPLRIGRDISMDRAARNLKIDSRWKDGN